MPAGNTVAGDKVGGDKIGRDKVIDPQGTVNVDNQGHINGVAVGVNLGTIVYGRAPAEDERQRLAWYLDSLANKLYRLPLRGIEQRIDQGDGIALPRVYVELATASEVVVATGSVDQLHAYLDPNRLRGVSPTEIKNPQEFLRTNYHPDWALPSVALIGGRVDYAIRPHERREDITVTLSRRFLATEALTQHQHLVLLGDPGSGKSTFLRHLAWTLALHGLDQPAQTSALFGWPDDTYSLPLLLPLRTLAGAIAAGGTQPAVVAAALSAELAASYNMRHADALVEQALHSGAALLLFDGLDEVPQEGASGRRADRSTVLQVIHDFARLYPHARVVLTCRTRAFDAPLSVELGWYVETIAPFTLGQIRHFVPAWYGELLVAGQIEQGQADQIGQKLIGTLTDPGRARLRAMAENPLLLTMMALVLYNQGELPRDRPQLYERILDLLLGQWDKLREGQSLAEAVGKPEWESRDFLPLLDRLCYEAHRDASSADGCGRLSRGVLYTALIDFFKQARVPRPGEAALCCLDYFEQRSGLLAADDGDTYVFAHLTLQEHGAGRYMAAQSDDPTGLMLQHRADDRWREPIMLGVGLLRPADLNTLLADLIDPEERERAKPAKRWQKDLILAAEIGADRDWNLLRTRPAIKVDRLQRDLRRDLVKLLSDPAQPLPIAERVRAGFLLGDLGDPRFPVTIDDWRRELTRIKRGDTSGYFCRVDAGTYTIGSADDDPDADDQEKPQHTVTFDVPFWIARYPITNAQWRMWADQDGQRPPYYAGDGSDLNRPNQPIVAITWHMCNTFCAWLSEQLGVTIGLPTEYEWEAAARGRDARRFPWGDEWQDDRAATAEDWEMRGVRYEVPVGCYPAGGAPCGALDMAGNVWELTTSSFKKYPAQSNMVEKEITTASYDAPWRGGSRTQSSTSVRCGARVRIIPSHDINVNGFRVVVAPQLARMF